MHPKGSNTRLMSSGKNNKHGLMAGGNQRAATASSLVINKGSNKKQQLNADENSLSGQLVTKHNMGGIESMQTLERQGPNQLTQRTCRFSDAVMR